MTNYSNQAINLLFSIRSFNNKTTTKKFMRKIIDVTRVLGACGLEIETEVSQMESKVLFIIYYTII